jgi:hypothetical protein
MRRQWPWIAKRVVSGVDVASDLAIDAWTERIPNDAGEVERQELEEDLAEWGGERFPKVEVPAWLVLLASLSMFVASKYVGAARKPKLPAKPVKPALQLVPPAAPADTTAPDSANDADSDETPATIPPSPQPDLAQPVADGSVKNAPSGF